MNYPELHNQVKVALLEKGLTMTDLAQFLKISRQALYNHLKAGSPNVFIVLLIAEFVDKPPSAITGDENFTVPENLFNVYWFHYFFERIENRIKRQVTTWNVLARKFKLTDTELKEKIALIPQLHEKVEAGEATVEEEKTYTDLRGWFLPDLLYYLNTDEEKFFFFRQYREKPEEDSPHSLPDFSDQRLNVSTILDLSNKAIKSKLRIMNELLGYFVKKYPDDPISEKLRSEYLGVDSIDDGSEKYEILYRIMRKETD